MYYNIIPSQQSLPTVTLLLKQPLQKTYLLNISDNTKPACTLALVPERIILLLRAPLSPKGA